MPNIPKPKPKNYSKILDMLNTPAAAKTFSPKTYVNLVGEYSKKAYDNNEISKKEYMDIIQPLFGDAGIMATEKIKQYENELNKYANGGRINFRGGDAARSDAASGRSAGRSSPSGGPDDRSSAAQTAAHNAAVAAAQASNTVDNNMNITNTLNKFRPNAFLNPYDYSINLNKNIGPFGLNVGINTLGLLGIDDPRTSVDESELDDYGISGGFNTDVLGGNLSLGGGYNPTTGTNFGLSFSKQFNFNQGGRVNFLKGGDTKYNAMVFKMYAEAGGQEGTGMDIDTFAEKYFPKMAQGGRIGYSNGSEDYGDLLDAYEKGIDVMPGESLTEYINRIREAEKRSKLND
jgi:hypothetical protein